MLVTLKLLVSVLLFFSCDAKKWRKKYLMKQSSSSSESSSNHGSNYWKYWHAKVNQKGCRGVATYKVGMYGTWSSSRQPIRYPSDAHYSPLTGASHNNKYNMWSNGEMSSIGVQSVAEGGNTGPIVNEFNQGKSMKKIFDHVTASGVISSTGTTSVLIKANKKFPLLSFIAMAAPSPDWFISFRNINMCDSKTGKWKSAVVLDEIRPYDAGTSKDDVFPPRVHENPQDYISRFTCDGDAFCDGGGSVPSMATFTITLENCVGCKNH